MSYRNQSPRANYQFKEGLKAKVIDTYATHYAKLGEIGILTGDCYHPAHPGYPARGWVIRFKGYTPWWYTLFFGWLVVFGLCVWRREEHMFENQLELVD
jgi:hypothetical protein